MIQRHYIFFIMCGIAAIASASESEKQWGGPFLMKPTDDDWTEISRDTQPQDSRNNLNKSRNTREESSAETLIKKKIEAAYSLAHAGWGNPPTGVIPDEANFVLLGICNSSDPNPETDTSQTEGYFTYFDVSEYLIAYFQTMYTHYPLVLPEAATYHQETAIARVKAKEKAQEEQVEFYVEKFQKLLDGQLPQKPSFLQQLALIRLGKSKK